MCGKGAKQVRRCHCGPLILLVASASKRLSLYARRRVFLMGNDDGRRWGRRNANASEASTTRSDFRMQAQAAASDCVTVETCRECGVPAPVLLNCLLCTPSARHNTPRCIAHVWRIRFPLSEATDDCGTGLWCQLVWTPSNPPSFHPPFYPPRQAILTTVTATCKLSIFI